MKTIFLSLVAFALLVPRQLMAQSDFPHTTVEILPFTSICQGAAADFNVTVIDDGRQGSKYNVALYKAGGVFDSYVALNVGAYTGTVTTRTAGVYSATNRIRVQFTMPRTLTAGNNYYMVLFCATTAKTYLDGQSINFTIKPLTTLTLSGSSYVIAGSPAPVYLTFTGTPPFTIDYNDYSSEYASVSYLRTQTFTTTLGTIFPRMPTFDVQRIYDNVFVRNLRDASGCPGPNTVSGSTTVNYTPLELTTFLDRSSSCAGTSLNAQYATGNSTIRLQSDFRPLIQLSDASGNFGSPIDLGTGTPGNATTTVTIPNNVAAGTGYRIRIISPRADYNALITPRSAAITITKADKPSVTTPTSPCQGDASVTLQATASGGTLNWYDASGNRQSGAPTIATGSAGTFSYKVSQTIGSCESDRVDVSATVKPKSGAPSTNQNLNYCQNQGVDVLSANGPNLTWYDASRNSLGGNAPRPSTGSVGQQTFFVSRDENGCRSDLTQITVNVAGLPQAPGVTNPGAVCQYVDVPSLTANGQNLKWYTAETGGSSQNTAKPGSDQPGTTAYWVSQVVTNCEGPRAKIEQTINPASPDPTTAPVLLCKDQQATPLTATGTSLKWYDSGNGLIGGNAPTPPTSQLGDITYRVTQTTNGCESRKVDLIVSVKNTPGAPGVADLAVCNNATAPVLTASGSGLRWYTVETGGTGAANAPALSTAQVGDQLYWISQSIGTCEGPRAKLRVTVNALPPAPTATNPAAVCQYVNVPVLSATGQNMKWYRTETGGTPEGPITPTSTTAGVTVFWVSQVVTNCEGPRLKIEQTISPASPDPTTSTVLLCRDQQTTPLTATGQNLKWYDSNNSPLVSAPTPPTDQVRDITYKVSQTSNGCESKKVDLAVQVRNTPGAPGVSPLSLCQNQTAQPLTATGAGLGWYTQATGGTATSALTPQTTTLGVQSYWVTQRFGTCESPRAALVTTVYAVPAAPTTTDRTFCINDTPTALTAVGQNLRWYDSSGTSKPGITPSTSTGQTLSYTVTQTQNGCESAGKPVNVRILNRATVRLTGDSAVFLYDSTAIRLRFGGDAPWRVRLWDGQTVTTSTSPLVKWVKPTQPGTASYEVQALDNECGAGQILNKYQLIVLAPLAVEPLPVTDIELQAYPVPASQGITVDWTAPVGSAVTLQLTNAIGQVSWQRERQGTGNRETERIDLSRQSSGVLILNLLRNSYPSKSIKLIKL